MLICLKTDKRFKVLYRCKFSIFALLQVYRMHTGLIYLLIKLFQFLVKKLWNIPKFAYFNNITEGKNP